ncbi:MAG: apolipoprotein N-acyltransferase, partial [Bacteroidota bacterium]
MNLKRYQRFLLAFISGILLCLAWTEWHLGLLLLVAFLPLLVIEDFFYKNKHRYKSIQVFFFTYIAFFIWNAISTWWIWYASPFGAVAAIVLNSMFMAVVWWLFHAVHRRLGDKMGYFSLIVLWVGFEMLHLNWELSWSWLTLGNGFSRNITLIQWYEYTGALGGSFWVLLINVLLFHVIKMRITGKTFRSMRANIIVLILVITAPIAFSLIRFMTYEEKEAPVEIVVLQPNIDPYNDKFGGMTEMQQVDVLLKLADSLSGPSTSFIIGPETAFPSGLWEDELDAHPTLDMVRQFTE